MSNSSESGKTIDQAYQVIRTTYKEINRLRDDARDLLVTEYDPNLIVAEEYSYSPNSLHLRPNHSFIFKNELSPEDFKAEQHEEIIFCLIVIFYDSKHLKRVMLKDEPELWAGLINVKNRGKAVRAYEIRSLLLPEERKNIQEKEILVDGKVFSYFWQSNSCSWKGRFVGYPLTAIVDREIMRANIFEKLFGN